MSGRPTRRLPSPALLIAVLALVVAVGGGAFASAKGGGGSSDKKSDKKIAKSVVTGLASGLSVSHATTAGHATTADSATVGGPVAFALVNADGTVNAAHSRGITSANVTTRPLATFCFTGLPDFKFAEVTPAWETNVNSASKSVEVGFPDGPNGALVTSDCSSLPVQVEVVTKKGAANDFSSTSGYGHFAFFIALFK